MARAGGGWTIGTVTLTAGHLSSIAAADYDGDGGIEQVTAEFDGLAASGATATLSYTSNPFAVVGFSVGS